MGGNGTDRDFEFFGRGYLREGGPEFDIEGQLGGALGSALFPRREGGGKGVRADFCGTARDGSSSSGDNSTSKASGGSTVGRSGGRLMHVIGVGGRGGHFLCR